ncbi:2OG-Fe(II) oxygenase [Melanogaster broomeanus]|nr:2OG-Fe(II) oxygenase [Melanogaster broomeanus]
MKVGFFLHPAVQNHSIPQTRYFSLPVETKMKPPLDGNIDPANNHKGDFHEGFEIGWEELEAKAIDEKRANDGAMTGSNVWPLGRLPWIPRRLSRVLGALFPLFALALELPETYFSDLTKNSAAIMRTLHYPLQDGHPDVDDETPGIGAHTDFECFTILWQQPNVQVLQHRLISIGDQLAMWTNDVFKSTVHRAMNKSGKERYSIPCFSPIPSCVSATGRPNIAPSLAGDYVNKRLKGHVSYCVDPTNCQRYGTMSFDR